MDEVEYIEIETCEASPGSTANYGINDLVVAWGEGKDGRVVA